MGDINNYLKLENKALFSKYYMYLDSTECVADRIFVNNKIKVKFIQDFKRSNTKYIIVLCKVNKKQCKDFESVMEKLKNNLLLCGHNDYLKVCEEVFSRFYTLGNN